MILYRSVIYFLEGESILKEYATNQIRNVAVVSHSGAGKTTMIENILFATGAITRLGKVEEGTTASDYDPEEIKRKVSINATPISVEWKDSKINFIDTPGYFDFVGEVVAAMHIADSGIVVVDAVGGVEVGTEKNWSILSHKTLPRIVVINKLDRENADYYRTMDELRDKFGTSVVPLQLPIGKEHDFAGVVDLVEKKAYYFVKGDCKKFEVKDIPADMQDQVEEYREMLVETASEVEDSLLEKYLEGESLTDDEVRSAVKKGTAEGKLFPVLCVSSALGYGINQLLDVISTSLPSADCAKPVIGKSMNGEDIERKIDKNSPFAAIVFKTIADQFVGKLTVFKVVSGVMKADSTVFNPTRDESEKIGKLFIINGKHQTPVQQVVAGDIAAVSKLQFTSTSDTLCDKEKAIVLPVINFPKPMYKMAVISKVSGDDDKIASGLHKLAEEDPTFKLYKNTETHQLIMEGIGDLQLDVIKDRLKDKFKVEMDTVPAKIPYRETIRSVAKVEGKHKKQSGGHGQFGHVWIEFSPLEPGAGFEFQESIFGGSVPRQYVPAVEKGLREVMLEGVLAGYPVVDFKANLMDGSYHPVDSSEMAFKIAAHLAFKKGIESAKPVLLEPIMTLEVTVPDSFMGDVIGDINSKRGRILGMEPQEGGFELVKAHVPLAELSSYAIDLRSITQGRGVYDIDFFSYDEVPERIKNEIIEAAKAAKKSEE